MCRKLRYYSTNQFPMHTNTRILTLAMLLAVFISACSKDEETPAYPLTSFESQAKAYFKEVALGFESGGASEITRRWESPVRIFVGGNYSPQHMDELNLTVAQLNEAMAPTNYIEVVSDTTQSNCYFHFGSAESYIELFPDMRNSLRGNVAYFNVWWLNDEINRSRIFIDTTVEFYKQQSTIREELAQSLGLGKDSPLYPSSIFYETATDGGFATSYSNLDLELVRLLYHPMMEIGLNALGADGRINSIYQAEAGN